MALNARFLALSATAVSIALLVVVVRYLGFGHGPVAGATPTCGIALAAALWLGLPGAVAAGIGYLAGALILDLPWEHAVIIALSHALAAAVAAPAMRALNQRRKSQSHISGHLVFLAGVGIFVSVVAAVALAAAGVGFITLDVPTRFLAVIFLFDPLGLITVFPVIAQARAWREVAADPWPAVPTVVVGATLIGILAYVLGATGVEFTAGVTLVLSMPFCLWVATQRRTLDGAAISLLASHIVLYLVLRDVGGSVLAPPYILTVLYLNLLILGAQFVNAVNRDRLAALAAVAAERADLERRVEERTALLSCMTERALAGDAEKKRLLETVDYEMRTPLNGVIGMASLVLAGRLDPETRGNVEMIRRSGFHLLAVVNRILDYSERAEDGAEAEDETRARAARDAAAIRAPEGEAGAPDRLALRA